MVGPSDLSVLWDSKCTLNHRLIVTLDDFAAFSEFRKKMSLLLQKCGLEWSWSGLLKATTGIHILSKWYNLPRFCYRRWNWGGLRIGLPKMCCGILGTALVSHFNCCVQSIAFVARWHGSLLCCSWPKPREHRGLSFLFTFECVFQGNLSNSIFKIFPVRKAQRYNHCL